MPKYLIERAIPEANKLSERDLIAIAKKSRRVLERLSVQRLQGKPEPLALM